MNKSIMDAIDDTFDDSMHGYLNSKEYLAKQDARDAACDAFEEKLPPELKSEYRHVLDTMENFYADTTLPAYRTGVIYGMGHEVEMEL